jgi:DNA-binding IclR family transcriptional regulator
MKISQSSENIVKLLSLFNEEREEIGLTEISKNLGLYPSRVHRIIVPLVQGGLIEQNPLTKKYRIGIKTLRMAMLFLEQHTLRKVARPHLESLGQRFNAIARLGMMDENKVIIIDQIQAVNSPEGFQRVTINVSLHSSAIGKIFLAFLPSEAQKTVIYSLNLKRHTDRTITDPLKLEREIRMAARKGYALDIGESFDGLNCVAAPIRNREGKVIAAVSLSHAETFLSREKCEMIAEELISETDLISQSLGYKSTQGKIKRREKRPKIGDNDQSGQKQISVINKRPSRPLIK